MPSRARIASASCLAAVTVEAVQPGGEQQVLHRAELLEEGGVDADPVDQALDRHLVALDVEAEDLDPTLVEGQQPADEADERRLARAVGAEDPVDVAALEAQVDVHDRRHRLALPADDEGLADAVDEQRGNGRVGGRPLCEGGHRCRLQLFDEGGHVMALRGGWVVRWRGWTWNEPRASLRLGRRWGLAARRCPGVRAARWGREGIKKAGGLDLAHGSWFVRWAVLPPAASSR